MRGWNERVQGAFAIGQTGGSAESGKVPTMLKTTCVVLAATLLALPAAAQDRDRAAAAQKQCDDQFKAADLNNDGVLSRTELGNAKQALPAALANKSRLTRKEFMDACSKNAT
jgi:hypothetical protein